MADVETFPSLAFDGGPGGLLEVLVLKQIETAYPGFLKATRLFSGTSAGSVNALVLASVEDGATKLDALEDFWQNIGPTFSNTPLGFVGAAFGFNALFNNKALIEHLSSSELLGSLTMSALPKAACAVAYNVESAQGMVLSNLRSDFPGHDWACVDVAVSSGASPMVMPAHRGFIDGGVFSNNPARPAISALYAAIVGDELSGQQAHPEVERVNAGSRQGKNDALLMRVLSIAGGQGEVSAEIGDDSWGYGRWLLDRSSFLRIIGIVLSATTQVGDVVGPVTKNTNYFRLDPNFVNKSFIPFMQADPQDLRAAAQSAQTVLQVAKAVAWLRSIDWVCSHADASTAAALPTAVYAPVEIRGHLPIAALTDMANRASGPSMRTAATPEASQSPRA